MSYLKPLQRQLTLPAVKIVVRSTKLIKRLFSCSASNIHYDNHQSNERNNSSVATLLPLSNPQSPRRWSQRFIDPKEQRKSPVRGTPHKVTLKRMMDSYADKYLLFNSDANTMEEYVNFYGGIRVAKLLEDLDDLAGIIAYKHCDDGHSTSPIDSSLTIVTASVDRIDLIKRPTANMDMKMHGFVKYVGHSSMVVTIIVENMESLQSPNHKISPIEFGSHISDRILTAEFTMVARDPETNKAAQVNPLLLETEDEKRLFQNAANLNSCRKQLGEQSLQKTPPTSEERLIIHDLWLESKQYLDKMAVLPDTFVWMKDTGLETVVICQPQDRNIHNFIFGGYLMKLAFELAYANASIFAKCKPLFLAMDDIWFRKPVPIGSILSFQSQVVYSSSSGKRVMGDQIGGKSFQIRIVADVINPEDLSRDTTNIFHFTFTSASDTHATPRIIPETYEESMLYLDGKRKWERGLSMAQQAGSRVLTEW